MRLNTKTRLAVNAMLDLALREESVPVVLATIAKRQHVSLSCIEQVFSRLRAAGLVQSTRGVGGGYALGRDASAISVADIVGAVEAGTPGVNADHRRPSLADEMSQWLNAAMQTHMARIALSDLAARQRNAGVVVEVRPRRRAIAAPRTQPRATATSVPNSVFELGTASAGARPMRR